MRVGLFVTCLVDLMRPSIGFASLKLLESAGCEVVVPETQTCCGQPGFNSGDRKTARDLALKFLHEFEGCDYVVAPSGSCAGMIRTHYADLFKDDPSVLGRLASLTERTYELTDFLVNVVKLSNIPGGFTGTITYHDSCSGLRELGVKQQPRDLLAKTPGLSLCEMNDATKCCGFGGTFSIKLGEISTRMAENKCVNIEATKADALVGGDLGCLLNIEGRLRRRGDDKTRVYHVAEILAGMTD
ncbi:MAG TPA: (Fe-S)-binding protein [Burkholderiales bacterium]|nr:(Fe-S)-binding protein [Burkholderiales bacterium]